MAIVKMKPSNKTPEKEAPKAKAKEAEQAAREKLMEKSVVALQKPIEAFLEAEKEVTQREYDIIDALKAEVQENEFTQKEASSVIKKALYEAKGLDLEKDKNPSLNSKVSRYVNLLGLYDKEVNGRTVKAAVLAQRIEEAKANDAPIAALHQVASGNLLPKDINKKRRTNANIVEKAKDEMLVNGKKPISDATVLGNEVGALLARANRGKMDNADVITTLITQYYFSRRTLDEDVSDDQLTTEVVDAGDTALASVNAAKED